MALHRTAEDRARFYALRAELNDLNAEAAAERKEKQRAHRKATKAAREEAPMKNQRQPRQRDALYLHWIRRQPCIGCYIALGGWLNTNRIEAAHVKCGYPGHEGWRPFGVQERSHDWRAVALCVDHHRVGKAAQHSNNERAWWDGLGVSPPEFCAALRRAYEAGEDGNDVIRRFASKASQHGGEPREGGSTSRRASTKSIDHKDPL